MFGHDSGARLIPSPTNHDTKLLLPRGYIGAAIATESFGRHDLVIHGSQIHTVASPRVDVVGESYGVVGALPSVGSTDTPELRERSVALDVRSAFADPIDVVSAPIAVYSAQRLSVAWWRKGAVAIHHVILDQWIGGPAVKG